MKSFARAASPLIIVFALVSFSSMLFNDALKQAGIDRNLVVFGNSILFLVTIASFLLFRRSLYAPNTHAFLRNLYSALFVKFFPVLIIAFVYIFFAGREINKAGFIIITILYFVYMFFEVALLMNLSRQIRNAKNV